ncbi:unnamed protein product, partial [Prorocentrum cordatum]
MKEAMAQILRPSRRVCEALRQTRRQEATAFTTKIISNAPRCLADLARPSCSNTNAYSPGYARRTSTERRPVCADGILPHTGIYRPVTRPPPADRSQSSTADPSYAQPPPRPARGPREAPSAAETTQGSRPPLDGALAHRHAPATSADGPTSPPRLHGRSSWMLPRGFAAAPSAGAGAPPAAAA